MLAAGVSSDSGRSSTSFTRLQRLLQRRENLGLPRAQDHGPDPRLLPRRQAVDDAGDGADERDLVDQLVGHGAGSLVLVPLQIQVLNSCGRLAEAIAGRQIVVEVLSAR